MKYLSQKWPLKTPLTAHRYSIQTWDLSASPKRASSRVEIPSVDGQIEKLACVWGPGGSTDVVFNQCGHTRNGKLRRLRCWDRAVRLPAGLRTCVRVRAPSASRPLAWPELSPASGLCTGAPRLRKPPLAPPHRPFPGRAEPPETPLCPAQRSACRTSPPGQVLVCCSALSPQRLPPGVTHEGPGRGWNESEPA